MRDNDKDGEDRADELQEVIDQLTSGAAAASAPPPTGPGGESLREAVHRRMRELSEESKTVNRRSESTAAEDNKSS
ncbi:hypothetical protein ACF1B0_35330 [Streptomyces anandii]|uniref:hypothetical protein n=1 Tax=Streptomyces anandii TaxID=285454 RepID=UPI0036FB0613